ncbi:IS66 family insertion sequence element accessory protein TnpA [Desulfogranum marinum]
MTNRAHKSRFWMAHVEAQAKSGLNRAEYCRQHKQEFIG